MLTPSDIPLIHTPITAAQSENEQRKLKRRMRRFDVVPLILGAIGLIALTWQLGTLLNPFVLIVALYIILAPYRDYHAARTIMWTAGVLFAFWFFWTTSGVLIPFFIAAVIAYLFNPLVSLLEVRYKIARVWSSIGIVVVLMGILTLLGWLFIPVLIDQGGSFIAKFSNYITQHASQLDEKSLKHYLTNAGVPAHTADQLVTGQVAPHIKAMVAQIPGQMLRLIEGIPLFVERLLNLIIVPFAAVYLLKDWPKLGVLILDLFPQRTRSRRTETFTSIDHVLYGYIRGQLTMAAILGVLGGLAYWALGIPYFAVLGLIIGISDLIPIIGIIFSVVIVELVIFLTMELSIGVVLSGVAVIGALHLLEAYILGPKIVGEGIGIPPVVMILSLIIFGYFLGFLGLLIAVPTTGVLVMFLGEYRKSQLESDE